MECAHLVLTRQFLLNFAETYRSARERKAPLEGKPMEIFQTFCQSWQPRKRVVKASFRRRRRDCITRNVFLSGGTVLFLQLGLTESRE